jgi:ribonuclease HI
MAKYKSLKIICDACCHKPNAHLGNVGKGNSACGVIFVYEDLVVDRFGAYLGYLTPPQAEYSGLIKALDKAAGICRGEIEVWMDSELVIRQMNGDYGIKSENMKPLYDEVKRLENRFTKVNYYHHRRNAVSAKEADKLAEQEYLKCQN